jgi:hypothetical protein
MKRPKKTPQESAEAKVKRAVEQLDKIKAQYAKRQSAKA